jgi:hypothetical protein
MTDVSVYYFVRHSVSGGKELLSKRRATLETIKGRGAAVLRSRRVVDHTEVDGNGFLIGGDSDESHPLELWPQIRSLELRAESRDGEALKIVEGAESDRMQTLHRESIELRDQARILRIRVDQIKADKSRNRGGTHASMSYRPPRPQSV